MNKWSCQRVIIDFTFEQHQLKPGLVQTPFDEAKQSVFGHALPSLLVWDRHEQGLLNASVFTVAVFAIFTSLF